MTTFLTAVTAVAAALAAGASWKYARDHARSVRATLLAQLVNQYSSDEMGRAVRRLYEWKKSFSTTEEAITEYLNRFAARDSTIDDVHWHRRRLSHYFRNVWALASQGLIDTNLLTATILHEQVEFFLAIVEPIDSGLRASFGRPPDTRVRDFFTRYLKEHPAT